LDTLNELQVLAVAGSVTVFFPKQKQATNNNGFASTKALLFAKRYGSHLGYRASVALKKVRLWWRTKVRFHFMGQRATEDLYTTQSVAVDRKLRQKVYYDRVEQHFQLVSPKAMRRYLYTDFVAIHTLRELQHLSSEA
jgi:hypothetical protein